MSQEISTWKDPMSSQIPTDSSSERQYWEKRLHHKWGLHGVGHISYGTYYNAWLYKIRTRVLERHTRNLNISWPQARVLDIGSGTGFWLRFWKARGARSITGCDFTRVAVKRLQREHPGCQILNVDISDSSAATTIGARFDLISAFDVLFHITSEDGYAVAISNIAHLLRPGGYFIFSDCFLRRESVRAEHQVNRSLAEVTRILTAAGLRTLRRAPMFVLMNTPIDTNSNLPKLVWRLAMAPAHFLPAAGFVYGAALFPIELLLTKVLNESPTTEIMICQKGIL